MIDTALVEEKQVFNGYYFLILIVFLIYALNPIKR